MRPLLLKDRDTLRRNQYVQGSEVAAIYHELFALYVLGDVPGDPWGDRHTGHGARSWLRKALHSSIEPLWRLARRLRPCLPAILARSH